ncbi:MAG TPA: cytochrome c [Gammaproteobacteria bacterium]|nr:cytochrome c [Gammaproteobacteria bacterium]
MKPTTKTLSTLVFASLFTLTAQAGETPDAAHGKALHDKNCTGCHTNMTGGDGSALYTRSHRKVTSKARLEAQVRRCEGNLKLDWFDDDIHDVVEYLNKTWYKFGE